MSFAWKIVTQDEEPLAEHSGPAFGHATLFRSEGYGLLSVSRFLHHGSIYTNTDIRCNINIRIDNIGIVKRTNDQLSYPHDYSYNTLEPDWDLIAQSAATLKTYSETLTINHVKGHQDDEHRLHDPEHLGPRRDRDRDRAGRRARPCRVRGSHRDRIRLAPLQPSDGAGLRRRGAAPSPG